MVDSPGPGVDEWVAETTAEERFEAVLMGLQGPRPVGWIAEVAVVAEVTAEDVVDNLVRDGAVTVVGEAAGDRVVRPDSEHVRVVAEREVRDAFEDEDELRELRNELQHTACGAKSRVGASEYRLDVVESVLEEEWEDG